MVSARVTDAPLSFERQHDANTPRVFASHSFDIAPFSAAVSSGETTSAKSRKEKKRKEKEKEKKKWTEGEFIREREGGNAGKEKGELKMEEKEAKEE